MKPSVTYIHRKTWRTCKYSPPALTLIQHEGRIFFRAKFTSFIIEWICVENAHFRRNIDTIWLGCECKSGVTRSDCAVIWGNKGEGLLTARASEGVERYLDVKFRGSYVAPFRLLPFGFGLTDFIHLLIVDYYRRSQGEDDQRVTNGPDPQHPFWPVTTRTALIINTAFPDSACALPTLGLAFSSESVHRGLIRGRRYRAWLLHPLEIRANYEYPSCAASIYFDRSRVVTACVVLRRLYSAFVIVLENGRWQVC